MNKVFLGIDTSNYRTSLSAVDNTGKILFQKAVLLDVPAGKRGLRQSEAFFHHSNRLPLYIEELFESIDPSSVSAIGVSERPRRVEGSYMPCFVAGVNAARELASALKIPRYGFSHQEGHAAAILESGSKSAPESSVLFHLSGGTTEALLCRPDETGYSMEIIGGTRDISLGQLLDRFGVALGLPFPSGQFIDAVAYDLLYAADHLYKTADTDGAALDKKTEKTGVIPRIKIDDGFFNLSGAETRLMRFAEDFKASSSSNALSDPAVRAVIAELFAEIAMLLIDDSKYLSEKYGSGDTYLAGGVSSSRTIRAFIEASDAKNIYFGDPSLSGDNSVGTALLTKRMYETRNSQPGK